MRYIGPFFRMNSLSQKEISGQLFYLSKESIKTIVLNSKCGLLAPIRVSKKSSINDISILNNFSPLLCLYRKASPMFIHSKSSRGFDESTFKKEITPSTNAFMTLCLLELSEYYSHYDKDNRNVVSLEKAFQHIAKEQLEFYSKNLRNNEGLFVEKKNISDANSKGFSLVDKNNKFKFSDQAFMMDAYYLYSYYNKFDQYSDEYNKFSHEILDMFKEYKHALYDLSFSENIEVFLALNVFYKYSKDEDARDLILDLGDFLISKFQEKDYYLNSIDNCALFSICLMDAYKHTEIISFKETAKEIVDRLVSLYDSDKNIFIKLSDKKEYKYSCIEVNSYILALMMSSIEDDRTPELKPIISGVYRKFFVNNRLLTSWPNAPTLDEVERYKKLSLRSDDMLDETYFRMPILPTPKSTGLAPIFIKSLTYSKKKDSLSSTRNSFDSNKNMFNFFLIIYLLKNDVENIMEFIPSVKKELVNNPITITDNKNECNSTSSNNDDEHINNKNTSCDKLTYNTSKNLSSQDNLISSQNIQKNNSNLKDNKHSSYNLQNTESIKLNNSKKNIVLTSSIMNNKSNAKKTSPVYNKHFKNKKRKKNKSKHPSHNKKK